MKIRAYYTGGRVFEDWIDAPSTGVLIVVVYRETGRTIYSGGDWYWLEGDEMHQISSGPWGTDKPPPDVPCRSCVKQGVGVSDEEFNDLYQRVINGDI